MSPDNLRAAYLESPTGDTAVHVYEGTKYSSSMFGNVQTIYDPVYYVPNCILNKLITKLYCIN